MKTIKLKLMIVVLAALPMFVSAQKSEIRKFDSFDKVESSGMFNVILAKGSNEAAKIEVSNFPLDKVITEVKNGVLKIYPERHFRAKRGAKVKVYVSYKNLKGMKNSGSGNMVCKTDIDADRSAFISSGSGSLSVKGSIKSDNIKVRNSGSGSVSLETVNAQYLNMDKSGSGSFRVNSGNVENLGLSSSGSGGMNLENVQSNNCTIKISGSGSARIAANNQLNSRISGSGSIFYKGNPRIDAKTSGSGRVCSL